MLLCLKKETEPATETPASLKNWTVVKDPSPEKKKIMSVNFPHALFSLLDFFTLEAGTDRLFQVSVELPLGAS
jgi:hypothetical protein